MTTHPICRDVERLLIAGEDRQPSAGDRELVEGHLRACARCRAFAEDRRAMREEAGALRWPAPPQALVRETRRLMLESEAMARPAGLPAWVLVALALAAVATGVWLAVALAGVTPETTLADLPVAGLAALFIIVQNALMLLLAPVVLRKVRARRGGPESA
jgi:anti-sigma factor RsiW